MEKINYDNKKFKAVSNSDNGEVEEGMIFNYQQDGNILSCSYAGASIRKGQLLGKVLEDGSLDFRYQQMSTSGDLMTGMCKSVPEILENGKIRLYETWEWTSGDCSNGTSILEEV